MPDRKKKDWSGIQKDVKKIQNFISQGLYWDERSWLQQYEELQNDPKFQTVLDRTFLELLAERLELHISEGQKALRQDLRQIQKLCDEYGFESNEQFLETIASVQNEQGQIFTSWFGQAITDQIKVQNKKRPKLLKKDGRTLHKKAGTKENDLLQAAETESLKLDDAPFDEELQEPDGLNGFSLDEVYSEAIQMAEEYNRKADPGFHSQLQDDGRHRKKRTKSFYFRLILVAAVVILAGGICLTMWLGPERIQGWLGQFAQGGTPVETMAEAAFLDKEQLSERQEGEPEEQVREFLHLELLPLASTSKQKEKKSNGQMDRQPDTGNHEAAKLPEVLSQYRQFAQNYPDVYGWLKIPGTEIDQPVMRCKEDTTDYFYLHHNYRGQQTAAGSLFVDSKSTIYPQDQNTVIYGHNMQNGHNFGILTNYEDPQYYKDHKTVLFDTLYETGTYEVVAVAKTRVLYQDETGFRYYYLFNYNDNDTFQKCREFIEKNKLYDTGLTLEKTDQTIMLSTCEYSIENGRLVVIARKV